MKYREIFRSDQKVVFKWGGLISEVVAKWVSTAHKCLKGKHEISKRIFSLLYAVQVTVTKERHFFSIADLYPHIM